MIYLVKIEAKITIEEVGNLPVINTVRPTIGKYIGNNDKVNVTDGSWSGGPTFAYQWQYAGVELPGDEYNWQTLSETSAVLDLNGITFSVDRVNQYVRCKVTGTNSEGSVDAFTDPFEIKYIIGMDDMFANLPEGVLYEPASSSGDWTLYMQQVSTTIGLNNGDFRTPLGLNGGPDIDQQGRWDTRNAGDYQPVVGNYTLPAYLSFFPVDVFITNLSYVAECQLNVEVS